MIFGFDVHHKQDSNLVITSLFYVIFNVLKRKGFLLPMLQIETNKCMREHKSIYLFALYAMFVELDIFKEVQLSSFIVEYTHEDND